MKKWLKSLDKEQIQRIVFVGLLVLVFSAFFISLSIAKSNEKNPDNQDPIVDDGNNNNNPNPDDNKETPQPETPTEESMGLPIKGDFVVVRKFYDPSYTDENLELAVIQYGKKYYTSKGIALTAVSKEDTSVCSVLSGEVTNVQENPIYGVVVTIKHDDNTYTEYSSLSKATVKVGDVLNQGDVIGTTGVCEFDSSLDSHVFFKVVSNNVSLDPETVVGKTLSTIGK